MRFKLFIVKVIALLVFCQYANDTFGMDSTKVDSINVYFFPGQGSDYRIFNAFELPAYCRKHFFELPMPKEGEMMKEYAARFIPLIDTTVPFVLIGTSLGGMISSELTAILKPLKTIVIASAKTYHELPAQYRFQRSIPINQIPPPKFFKIGGLIAQPIFEPDRREAKDMFISMLKAKDPVYLKRTVNIIINWDRSEAVPGVYHIHGDNDHTLPIKNIECDVVIKNGSHMMTHLRHKEICEIIRAQIEEALENLE